MSSSNRMLSNVNTDILLAETLTNFDSTYIINVVRQSLNMRFRPYNTAMPGLNSVEMHFQQLLRDFTDRDQQSQIYEVRRKTYDEIIAIVCQYYAFAYNPDENIDNFTVAYFLYNTFVSNFSETIINFYVRYIIDHQEEIYTSLTISENKESMDGYSKKLYGTAAKLGHIHSQINLVLANITGSDITLDMILKYGSGDPNCINVLLNTITDTGDVWKLRFAPFLDNLGTRADLITNVKLQLQQFAIGDISIIAPGA